MSILDTLKKNAIFQILDNDSLNVIAKTLKTRSIPSGEILFHLGDPGTEMIIVQEGQIAIYMPEKDQPHIGQAIRVFKSGELFGEMALIDQKPRSTSARAETDALIAGLSLDGFVHMLENYPKIGVGIMAGLSERIRYTTEFVGEMGGWVQRIADGQYNDIKGSNVQDKSLASLAAEFVRMAAKVRAREEKLQQEVAQLRIEIDQAKRSQEVKQITESEYYQSMKAKLRAMREADDD